MHIDARVILRFQSFHRAFEFVHKPAVRGAESLFGAGGMTAS
jgi:hypothetical protein